MMRWQVAESVLRSSLESCLRVANSGLVTKVTTRFARSSSGGSGGRPRGIERFLLFISNLQQSSERLDRRKPGNRTEILLVHGLI